MKNLFSLAFMLCGMVVFGANPEIDPDTEKKEKSEDGTMYRFNVR